MAQSNLSTSSEELSTATVEPPSFALFCKLPPELRTQIFLAAIPSPGINFFNIHSIPNDHEGANRSTSPSTLHLDLRRLAIEDDDEDVAEYDPSAWQARHALRETCREARGACRIPDEKLVTLTLTKPKRGLFVRATDGKLRSLTPLHAGKRDSQRAAERLVRRRIQVHADEMLCFSIENCSFNLPFEEEAILEEIAATGFLHEIDNDVDSEESDSQQTEEDEPSLGWAYDPKLEDVTSVPIAPERCCFNFAFKRGRNRGHLREVLGVLLAALVQRELPRYEPQPGLMVIPRADLPTLLEGSTSAPISGGWMTESFIAFDSDTVFPNDPYQEPFINNDATQAGTYVDDGIENSSRQNQVRCRDRWGDIYVEKRWYGHHYYTDRQLVKQRPETTEMRLRYLRSASVKSPKRPW